ncbi:Ribosome biogenesis protein enp2 [Vanrija pseudolonga]|uniref:Ribosome biogenesis protein enp2 n=1 Tax=Vanrija pseudolonga TaxID=143232 RepID=A0AAF0YAQ8_9TREE|nr:Ribosome biogenesis protein enp2 [Vanrija pseudolonga]
MPAPTAFPKVYTVNGPSSTSSTSLPSWVTIKARPTKTTAGHKKRVRTQHTLGQLELIQDFAFPVAAIKIRTTADGLHAVGTGTYKPMIKVWDLEQLTEKFQRVTDAENVDFVLLSDDWTKSLHLQRDRSLQLHTQGGLHHTVRLPIYGRALGYHAPSADALVACTGTEVFRFNLEEGRYMTPLDVAKGWGNGREREVEGVNCLDVNPRHGLWSFGLDGAGGVVEFWDPRSRSSLTRLHLPTASLLPAQEYDSFAADQKLSITSLKSHPTDGLSLAVGTSSGHTLLYDLRSATPFAVKDQGYGEAVRCVDWLRGGGHQEDSGRVVSADSKVIKVWDKNEPSTNHLSLHPPNPLVDLHPVPESGLMFVACEAAPLSTYYVPEFGPAPRWASFLDSVTEEMANETTGAGKGAYSDFKFVDRAELETLGLTHLIGTPTLKPYMHGFFLALKLYQTARLIANPQSYAEHREKIVAERMAAKTESRIRAKREQPKVNKALAERLRKEQEREEAVEKRKRAKRGEVEEDEEKEGDASKPKKESVLADPRFAELFENPDFEIDESSRTFALLNPATANKNAAAAAGGRFKTAVEEEEDDSDKASSLGYSESEEEEEEAEAEQAPSEDEPSDEEDDSEEEDDDESDDGDLLQYDPTTVKSASSSRSFPATGRRPQLVVGGQSGPSKPQTFGQRLQASSSKGKAAASVVPDGVLAMRRAGDGGMEMSFVPQQTGKGLADDADEYSGGSFRKRDKVERFGAGLEKGGEEEADVLKEGGRTKRRHVERSASKNAFRRR